MTDEVLLQAVDFQDHTELAAFMEMGRAYLDELHMEPEEAERFLDSIIRRQREPNRRLTWLRSGKQTVGFVHSKIDEDAPNVGWILEFYVTPSRRKTGIGRRGVDLVHRRLRHAGICRVLLTSDADALAFWHSCGYRDTGREQRGQAVMECAL